MIQNILQHKKPQASLQKIIDLNNNQVITDPSEIHQTLSTYYTNLFDHPNNFPTLPHQWEKDYQPIEHIQDEWYSDLLITIEISEIQSTIQLFQIIKPQAHPKYHMILLNIYSHPLSLNFSFSFTTPLSKHKLFLINGNITIFSQYPKTSNGNTIYKRHGPLHSSTPSRKYSPKSLQTD
jgi:hypothetical protein